VEFWRSLAWRVAGALTGGLDMAIVVEGKEVETEGKRRARAMPCKEGKKVLRRVFTNA